MKKELIKDSADKLCPICHSFSKNTKDLKVEQIKPLLSEHFKNKITSNVEIVDYSLLKCSNCSYEFAYPQIEGSSSFYDWVTLQNNYYPPIRWEYEKTLSILENKQVKLLDVGCGDGRFLDFIKKSNNKNIDYAGLDPTKKSVEICLENGHKAYCMDIKMFKTKFKNKFFDYVTIFHVLEHIAFPKEFLEELISLTKPGGAVFASTPYSPMDFEVDWFDVLNHPPHHMGRWNLKSYKTLAEILNLKIEFFMPKQRNFFKSGIKSFRFSIYGNSENNSKIDIIKCIIRKPYKFLNHLYIQSKRDTLEGARAANVILVKFTKRNN
jgi:2-polyprenyl-3-methyl-5-hydroxy-6-metoxy-1,4-benzoquinol methylase